MSVEVCMGRGGVYHLHVHVHVPSNYQIEV